MGARSGIVFVDVEWQFDDVVRSFPVWPPAD
jgi:hypothetical protein